MSDAVLNSGAITTNGGRFQPGNPYRVQLGQRLPGAGRKPRPAVLKQKLPWACQELIKLAEQNDDIDIKYKAIHDIISWNIGRPGSELFDEEPEDVRAFFTEIMIQYGFKVVKDEEKPNATPNALPDASGLRNGSDGDAK